MAPSADQLDSDLSDSPQGPLPSLLQFLWRRKSLILLGLVVGLVLGILYYVQRQPIYQSSAQVMVLKKAGNQLPSAGTDPRTFYYEDYLSTHQILIKSPTIVQEAVKKHQLQDLKTFEGKGDPTGAIIAALTVTRDNVAGSSTNILTLSFSGPVPEDCATVLAAVIDSYKDFLDQTYRNVSDETVKQITEATKVLQKDLDDKRMAYVKFQANSPLIYSKGEGTNPKGEWLTQLQTKRLNLLVRQSEVQGRLKSIEQAVKDGRGAQALAQIATSFPKNGPTTADRTLEEQLYPLEMQEQVLLADWGPDHPEVVAVRKRIALTKKFFNSAARDRDRSKPPDKDASVSGDPVQRYIVGLKQELADIEESIQAVTKMYLHEEKEARELALVKDMDQRMRDEIARTRQSFEPIIQRLEEIKLVRDLGGYDARVIAPAGRGWKIGPNPYQILLAAVFLGMLAGMSLAYLAEITDKSFHTPEEIRRWLGLPVIGHIPVITVDPELLAQAAPGGIAQPGIDPILCTHYHSHSFPAESFRGLRTALYFSTQGEVHKVIQITSPGSQDGKSTLTANLAVSMVQSGKKVLLIDADFRKPRQHKIFGMAAQSPSVGLASVIAHETEIKDAIQETKIPGLFLLPCGPRPHNPAELLTCPRFQELLATLREDYDFILIDTPPLLAVSDPSVVAPRVDGVLLIIRVSKNGRPNAERAREILHTLGATVLGVVVNGVGRGSGFNGYGNANYHSGYQYQYAYYDDGGYYEGNGSAEPDPAGANPTEGSANSHSGLPRNSGRGGRPSPRRRSHSSSSRRGLLARLVSWWQ